MSRREVLWRAGIIVLAGVLACASSLSGPFLFDDNDVLLNLGYALVGSGRLLEAVRVLERAVASNPSNGAARDLLGRVRDAAGEPPLTNRRN